MELIKIELFIARFVVDNTKIGCVTVTVNIDTVNYTGHSDCCAISCIEFKGLDFKYPGSDVYALKNVNLHIKKGESVGIVGKTGSGKTTLVDLMLRCYNVPEGKLFVDGHDVNDVTIKSLRKGIAYVPQDNFLFSDTIENNISFGVQGVQEDEVKNAAVLAHVDDNIVEFKEGYKTILGERGVTVSGGQKQRISIARALMKDSPVLILDDSVSAVDTKTEETILKNLKNTRSGKTTILIAHRITTVEKMDTVVLVGDGTVIDCGTHLELYERCAEYRRMVELQKLESEGGEDNNA